MKEQFNFVVAGISTICTWIFGGWDMALYILILFMVIDYITGVIKSYLTKELSSNIGFNGLVRKTTIFLVLFVAVGVDRILNNDNWIFRTLTCYFFVANEGISIIENVAVIGIPVPKKLIEALKQLKGEGENE